MYRWKVAVRTLEHWSMVYIAGSQYHIEENGTLVFSVDGDTQGSSTVAVFAAGEWVYFCKSEPRAETSDVNN